MSSIGEREFELDRRIRLTILLDLFEYRISRPSGSRLLTRDVRSRKQRLDSTHPL